MSVLSLLLAFGLAFAKDDGFRVRRVSPEGEAKQVSQIRVEFTAPAVRFGSMNAEAPVSGDCLKGGEGRWIDPLNWVFDFKEPLPGGLRCRLNLAPLKSVAGRDLEGKKEFSFTTGGASVKNVFPETWNELDEDQSFIAILDADVDPASVAKNVFLSVEGLGDRLPVEVQRGSDEMRVLEAFRRSNSWQAKEILNLKNGRIEKTKPLTVFRSPRRFPFGASVALHWGPGVLSASGVPSTDPQIFEYKVRADFTASFSCSREQAGAPCIPLLPMSLQFTTAVKNAAMKKAYIEDGKGRRFFPDMVGREDADDSSWFEFKGPFEPKTAYRVALPAGLKDQTGRPLANAKNFPLATATGENPPLLKFAADFGVLEADGATLPVTVRDIEAKAPMAFEQKLFPLQGQVQRLDTKSFAEMARTLAAVKADPYGPKSLLTPAQKAKRITLAKPSGEKEFEVVGIPLKSTGFYFVEVESPRLGASLAEGKTPFYVRSTALVTNLAVQLKYTEKEAFVWVTRLRDVKPVGGAQVELFDCAGTSLGTAKTAEDGTARVTPPKGLKNLKSCDFDGGFYAVAAKDGDFSFASSQWDQGIEVWRYRINTDDAEPVRAHTVLDRNLLRPGEAVSMKHVLRRGTKDGFGLFPAKSMPAKMVLEHDSGLQKFEFPLKWNASMGTAEAQWKIPAGVKLGRWHVRLGTGDDARGTVTFRIENYKVPLLKGRLQLPAADLVSPSKVQAQIGVEYLAGGGAGPLDVKTRWSVSEDTFVSEDDELNEFRFLNGGVKPGLSKSPSEDEERESTEEQKGSGSLKLAMDGTGVFEVGGLKPSTKIRNLRVEAEYRDPNGESQTTSARAQLWPTDRVVGIKAVGWGTTRDKITFDTAVLDLKGKPVEGADVEVEAFQSKSLSHRKRLVGGFYAYESTTETTSLGRLCKGRTDRRGRLRCQGSVKEVGTIRAVARTKDTAGRLSEASDNQWVVDNEERLWFGSGDADRIDLIPSKKRYEPGENAEFLVQAPFRQARLLLTVEREGVIEHKIVDWDAARPAVTLPVKASWAPNVFVSALVVRGRVADAKATALIDLDKPAFKMGLAEIRVGWRKHELKVKVDTDAKVYPVRGKAKARIKVVDAAGKPTAGEISIAAVDEGLLQLLPNSTWQLLERMMDSRALLVKTASMQNQIVGKRHFGLKAVPAGGDGGRANTRELFDTLLLWKGTVKLDAKGEAEVDIPINDSLTSFRVVAVALNGRDQFGTGWTSFRTTQELMIFAGAPTLARFGDRLVYAATVRNAGTAAKNLEVSLKTEPAQPTENKRLNLAVGQSAEVVWNLALPVQGEKMISELSAKEGGRELDRLKTTTSLVPVWRPTVRQSTLLSLEKPVKMPVGPTEGALAGSQSLIVEPVAGLASGRGGLEKFWADYAYGCLEQNVSRAVSLKDEKAWRKIETELETYLDDAGRLKLFPGPGEGSAVLNAYVLRLVKEAGWRFSAEREGKLLAALEAAAERRENGGDFRFADGPARQVTALETLSRYGRFRPTMMAGLNVTPNLWPTSTLVEWLEFTRRETKLKDHARLAEEAEKILRARMVFTGGRFAFSDEKDDDFWWLYRDSGMPLARLILLTATDPAWKDDLPRVLRGFIDRQTDGAWALTTTNAWGRLALDRYQSVFEKDPVTGRAVARLEKTTRAWDWAKGRRGELTFPGPVAKTELEIRQEGAGRPLAFVRAVAAVPLTKPVSSGYFVEKSVESVQRKSAGVWSRGDVVKVTLKIRAVADSGWVVINEPLPPGGVVLGTGFGNDSNLLQTGAGTVGLWPAFEERSLESLKMYYRWVPRGDHVVEYRLRLNQAGSFRLPATRIEAMYDPDVFAETPNASWEIRAE